MLGLNKRNAFSITVSLCVIVMLFPRALELGLVIWWIMSIMILFFSLILWTNVHIKKTKDKVLNSHVDDNCIQNQEYDEKDIKQNEELLEQTEETIEHNNAVQDRYEEITEDTVEIPEKHNEELLEQSEEINEQIKLSTLNQENLVISINLVNAANPVIRKEQNILSLSIEELIDLGFKEKYRENFEQAAFYFTQALFKDPTPDLAFYLITDCYWLWNKLEKRDYALIQLLPYIQKYLPLFNHDLRLQFDTWIVKENLQIL